MKERISFDDTPKEIIDWLMCPYKYFSDILKDKKGILLDIACGNNLQIDILKNKFKQVISMDFNISNNKDIIKGDILNIPLKDKSVDYTFSFETIEHVVDHERVLKELKRVTRKEIVIGSVNKTGPSYLNDVLIYKGEDNPYHLKELDIDEWDYLFKKEGCYYGCILEEDFKIIPGLSNKNISNYIKITL